MYCCTTTVLLYYYCTTTELLLNYYCTTIVLLYYYCTTVLLLYYYCTTTVLLYYYCTTAVLLLYYYCTSTVLLLKLQVYLAFTRSTSPIHGKGCASRRNLATLPRVQVFDLANPWEGLRVTPKPCNFTSRSSVRPRQSMVRVAFPIDGTVLAPALERVFQL